MINSEINLIGANTIYIRQLSEINDWLNETKCENNVVIFRFRDRNCNNNKNIHK